MESPDHIASRLLAAAEHHPPEKLHAAPDCGLVAVSQCAAMVEGARMARQKV